jgi:death-on-curing protein
MDIEYLSLEEVYWLHHQALAEKGGDAGVRYPEAVESAVAQPQMTFGGEDLYPTLADKAATLSFSLIKNHAFVDGNKRVGHAAMETFLVTNGYELAAGDDEQERVIFALADNRMEREEFTEWVVAHVIERTGQ